MPAKATLLLLLLVSLFETMFSQFQLPVLNTQEDSSSISGAIFSQIANSFFEEVNEKSGNKFESQLMGTDLLKPSPSVTPTPTRSASPTPSSSPTRSSSSAPSSSVSPSASTTRVSSPLPTPSTSAAPSLRVQEFGTPTPSLSVTPSITPTASITPTVSPSPMCHPTPLTLSPGLEIFKFSETRIIIRGRLCREDPREVDDEMLFGVRRRETTTLTFTPCEMQCITDQMLAFLPDYVSTVCNNLVFPTTNTGARRQCRNLLRDLMKRINTDCFFQSVGDPDFGSRARIAGCKIDISNWV